MLLARVEALLRQQERLRARHQAESREDRGTSSAGTSQHGAYETQLRAIIQAHLHEDGFGVEQLASAAAASRPTLFRRLKEEADISPSTLLSDMRLERAEALLAAGEGNVSEVAYAVGFVSLAGFSRAYKRRFGVSPASHLRSS
jgi:AraC-like DNA-binding protein